jgi:hypothetical protein
MFNSEGIFLDDAETGESTFYSYADLDKLDDDIRRAVFKPIEGSGFIYPADLFVQMPFAQTPFYVMNWLPKHGKACLYAAAKAGKSTIAVQLGRCIGIGEQFLGVGTTIGRVLYLQAELSVPVLQQRMRDTHQVYPNLLVGTLFSLKLDTPTGRDILAQAVQAVQPNVLIIDPLYKMMNGDENEAHDMLVVVDALDRLIEIPDLDLGIWINHHSGYDTSHPRGSTVLQDWVDSSLEVKRISKPGDPLQVKLTPKLLRHSELPPESIEAEWVDGEFELIGAMHSLEANVISILSDHAEHPIYKLLEATQSSRSGINKVLSSLLERGAIERVGRGVYKIT